MKMFNLIKADFYKLIRRKAFYVFAVLAILLPALSIWSINYASAKYILLYPDFFNSLNAVEITLGYLGILPTIMMTMFICSEFSFGTIKNTISIGKSRAVIYLSKLVMSLFVITAYTLINVITSFVMGSILWGSNSSATRSDYLDIIKYIGFVILIDLAMQSIFAMLSFIFRTSGAAISVNVLISFCIGTIFTYVSKFISTRFSIEKFDLAKYWPDTYRNAIPQVLEAREDMITCLIVCAVAIVVPTLIGIVCFEKSEIK